MTFLEPQAGMISPCSLFGGPCSGLLQFLRNRAKRLESSDNIWLSTVNLSNTFIWLPVQLKAARNCHVFFSINDTNYTTTSGNLNNIESGPVWLPHLASDTDK